MTVTAGWSLPALIDAWSRAGWGPLTGRTGGAMRDILAALGRLLPSTSAAGEITAYQLADASGISDRWVRRCLTVLEISELIQWRRGTVIDGRPTAGWIRINKKSLAALVAYSRRELTGRLRARAAATIRRLQQTLRMRTIRRQRRRTPALAQPQLPIERRDPRARTSPPPPAPHKALSIQQELRHTPPSLNREESLQRPPGRAVGISLGGRRSGPVGPRGLEVRRRIAAARKETQS